MSLVVNKLVPDKDRRHAHEIFMAKAKLGDKRDVSYLNGCHVTCIIGLIDNVQHFGMVDMFG